MNEQSKLISQISNYIQTNNFFSKTGRNISKLAILFALGGFQGFLGWWMVKSGLDDRILKENKVARVDQTRLTAHLGSAFVLYSALTWFALDFLKPNVVMSRSNLIPFSSIKRFTASTFFLVFATAMSGALVAGLDAGFKKKKKQIFYLNYFYNF